MKRPVFRAALAAAVLSPSVLLAGPVVVQPASYSPSARQRIQRPSQSRIPGVQQAGYQVPANRYGYNQPGYGCVDQAFEASTERCLRDLISLLQRGAWAAAYQQLGSLRTSFQARREPRFRQALPATAQAAAQARAGNFSAAIGTLNRVLTNLRRGRQYAQQTCNQQVGYNPPIGQPGYQPPYGQPGYQPPIQGVGFQRMLGDLRVSATQLARNDVFGARPTIQRLARAMASHPDQRVRREAGPVQQTLAMIAQYRTQEAARCLDEVFHRLQAAGQGSNPGVGNPQPGYGFDPDQALRAGWRREIRGLIEAVHFGDIRGAHDGLRRLARSMRRDGQDRVANRSYAQRLRYIGQNMRPGNEPWCIAELRQLRRQLRRGGPVS